MKLRLACLVTGCCLLVAQLVSPTAQTIASAAEPIAPATCQGGTPSDVDGNGVGDLIVGGYTSIGSLVLVRHPGDTREPLGLSEYSSDPQVAFRSDGGPAAMGDLDGDGCADLVFPGSPYGPGSATDKRLYVVPGSPSGPDYARAVWFPLPAGTLSAITLLPQSRKIIIGLDTGSDGLMIIKRLDAELNLLQTTVVSGSSLGIKHKKARRGFGYALAADGDTIVVGSPREYWRGDDAGAVYLFSASTLRHRRITERSKGFAPLYAAWSMFGCSVAYLDGRLAIGACYGETATGTATGRVFLAKWNEHQRRYKVTRRFGPGDKGVPGKAINAALFGCRVVMARGLTAPASYDVAISACYDQPKKTFSAGSVMVTNFDRGGYQRFVQGSGGVPGTIGVIHQFGTELAVRHLSPTSDALVATAIQDVPGTPCDQLVATTSGGLLRSSTWSIVPPNLPNCYLSGWGQYLAG